MDGWGTLSWVIVRDHVFTAYLLSADCCCGVVRFAGWAAVTNALLSPLTRPHTAPSDGRLEGNPSVGRFREPLL